MESRILRFTIRFYDSIHETLPTIQGKIPILITLDADSEIDIVVRSMPSLVIFPCLSLVK